MTSFARTLRLLVFGETWILPLGLLASLLVNVALRELTPGLWRHAGGFVLLAEVIVLLACSVARGARAPRSAAPPPPAS